MWLDLPLPQPALLPPDLRTYTEQSQLEIKKGKGRSAVSGSPQWGPWAAQQASALEAALTLAVPTPESGGGVAPAVFSLSSRPPGWGPAPRGGHAHEPSPGALTGSGPACILGAEDFRVAE